MGINKATRIVGVVVAVNAVAMRQVSASVTAEKESVMIKKTNVVVCVNVDVKKAKVVVVAMIKKYRRNANVVVAVNVVAMKRAFVNAIVVKSSAMIKKANVVACANVDAKMVKAVLAAMKRPIRNAAAKAVIKRLIRSVAVAVVANVDVKKLENAPANATMVSAIRKKITVAASGIASAKKAKGVVVVTSANLKASAVE